jgi:hypothetical protein
VGLQREVKSCSVPIQIENRMHGDKDRPFEDSFVLVGAQPVTKRIDHLCRVALLLGLIALLAGAGVAKAHEITSGSVTGPGGFGNPNFFSSVSEPSLTYTSLDYLDVTLTVDSDGYYDLSQAPGLGGVFNATGTTWTGFKVEILSSNVGVEFTPLQFAPPGKPLAYDYGNKFPSVAWSPSLIIFSGGTLPNLTTTAPVMAFQMAGAGTVTFRETPIVPEPSSCALGLLGGVSLVGWAWRKRRSAVAAR